MANPHQVYKIQLPVPGFHSVPFLAWETGGAFHTWIVILLFTLSPGGEGLLFPAATFLDSEGFQRRPLKFRFFLASLSDICELYWFPNSPLF